MFAPTANAATIPVTTNADSGAGSLRAALTQANNTAEADTITVPPMTITLTSGRLNAIRDVTIAGAGEGQTILDGGGTQEVIGSNTATLNLTLSGMTVRNGNNDSGGAVSFLGASLTVDHVTFSNNRSGGAGVSGFGAAIDLGGGPKVTLTIRDSTFDSNVAGGGGGFAHGIVTAEGSHDYAVTIQRSTFTGNKVGGGGNGANLSEGDGIVYFNATAGHTLDATIESSTFADNTLGGGTPKGGDGIGAVENNGPGTLRVYNSTFARNIAGGGGTPNTDNNPGGSGRGTAISATGGTLDAAGNTFTRNKAGGGGSPAPDNTGSPGGNGNGAAINVFGASASIRNNTFSENTAGGNGGGNGGKRGNGGAVYAGAISGSFTFTGNLVRDNRAGPDAFTDGVGGGLALEIAGGTQTVANNTFDGNTAGAGGANDATHQGGGIYVNASAGATALLRNLTIVDNAVRNVASGGGIYAQGNVRIANSILADNLKGATQIPVVENCAPSFKPASDGHNIENGTSCAFGLSTDKSSTEPSLGPLQDNGGPTLTRAPTQSPVSPALNTGDNSLCPPTDQRGGTRPAGAACEIGAVEITPPVIAPGAASADSSSANLPFDIDTGAAATNYHVEYGPAGGALTSTADANLPGASGATAVNVPIGGLAPGVTYQYELVASNVFGTTRSGVRLVTTASASPVLTPPILTPPATLSVLSLKGSTKKATQGMAVTFTYGLSSEAKVKLSFVQLIPGRKKSAKSKCSRSLKKGKRCTISKTITALSQNGKTGTNKLKFSGKFGRKKSVLPAGKYNVVLSASAAGQKTTEKKVALTVVKAKKKKSRKR